MNHSAWILGAGLDVVKTTASTNLSIEISKALADEGIEATLVPLNRQSASVEPTEPAGKIDGIQYRLIRIPLLDNARFPLGNWVRGVWSLFVVAFRLLTAKPRPQLLFCMTMWWWAALSIATLGKIFRIKTVYYLVEEPAALARMQFKNQDTSQLALRLKLVQARLIYFALRFFDIVCCIVQPLADRAIENGVATERVWVLPNMRYLGVDQSNSEPQPKSAAEPNAVAKILYTGRINYTRDEFETLLSAAEMVKGAEHKFQIEIYGSGPAKDLELINQRIEKSGLQDIVLMRGFVSKEELTRAQQEATAFLLLKADIDQNLYNFPTKLMDYLDHGHPVIMTRIYNHAVYFEDRVNCFFVEPQDPAGLCKAIHRCVDSQEQAFTIGVAGQRVLQVKFNASLEVKRLLAFSGLTP